MRSFSATGGSCQLRLLPHLKIYLYHSLTIPTILGTIITAAEGALTLPISGKEMLKRFQHAGWTVLSRKGSHVKVSKGGLREIIPMHKELKKGLEQKPLKRIQSRMEE